MLGLGAGVFVCLFVCSPSVGQLAREALSAGSWGAGLPPSLVPGQGMLQPPVSMGQASPGLRSGTGEKDAWWERAYPQKCRDGAETPNLKVL